MKGNQLWHTLESSIGHTWVVSVSRPTSRCCELNSRANHRCASQELPLMKDVWLFAMKNLEQIPSFVGADTGGWQGPWMSHKVSRNANAKPCATGLPLAWEMFHREWISTLKTVWAKQDRYRWVSRTLYHPTSVQRKSWKHLRHSDSVVESWKLHQISGKRWCQIFCGEECLGSEPRSRRWPQIPDIKDPFTGWGWWEKMFL